VKENIPFGSGGDRRAPVTAGGRLQRWFSGNFPRTESVWNRRAPVFHGRSPAEILQLFSNFLLVISERSKIII